jgi:signal transduction histidine kinase
MLNDLLDFTSSQLGSAMPVYPVQWNLETTCRELIEEFRAAGPGKSFIFEADGDLEGVWDPDRLRQAISNLLFNAVHHGAKEEPVSLTLRGGGEMVRISVHNLGEPIPGDALGILFDPMVRMASTAKDRPQGSIGLGLYICREVARAHGGDIHIASSLQEGTTFTLEIPRVCPPEATVGP